MYEKQETIEITQGDLLKKVKVLFDENYRLIQMCCAQSGNLYIDYSFDKAGKFLNYRVQLDENNPQLPSITGIYFAAFTYENEIHDLFGVKIDNIAIDFKGKFYRKKEATPFLTKKPEGE